MVRSMASGFSPSPTESAPCGSMSTSRTRRSCSASAAPRLIAVVVLPTPPFWFAIEITFVKAPLSFGWGEWGLSSGDASMIGAGFSGGHPGYPQRREMSMSLCKDIRVYSDLSTVSLRGP